MNSGTSPGAAIWVLWTLHNYAENPPGSEELCGGDAERARDIGFVTQAEGNHYLLGRPGGGYSAN